MLVQVSTGVIKAYVRWHILYVTSVQTHLCPSITKLYP